MSATVYELSEHKKKPVAKDAPHYFCQKCQGEKFKAFENGRMRCASCGAGIKNLTVIFHPESA